MFALFERLLKPTDSPEQAGAAGRAASRSIGISPARRKALFAALFVAGFVVALLDSTDPGLHGPHRHAGHVEHSPQTLFAEHWPHAARHGGGAAAAAAARA